MMQLEVLLSTNNHANLFSDRNQGGDMTKHLIAGGWERKKLPDAS